MLIISVIATVITLPIKAAAGRSSAATVFTEFMDMGAGWPVGMVSSIQSKADVQQWVLGLIQGAYCFSATGMLPAMSEEAISPDTTIPRAM